MIPGFIDVKAAQCLDDQNAEATRGGASPRDEEGRRQLREESLNLYKEGPRVWRTVRSAESRRRRQHGQRRVQQMHWSNGNACVIRSGCQFAFRGSDDFQIASTPPESFPPHGSTERSSTEDLSTSSISFEQLE